MDSSSMPPPPTVPERSPMVPGSPARTRSVPTVTPTRQSHKPGAYPMSSPSRRPSALHSSPHAQTPRQPVEPMRVAIPISTPSRDSVSRPTPVQAVAVPPAASSSTNTSALPPILPHLDQSAPSQIDTDSQIDPALIKAVVTALRQVDQAEAGTSSQPHRTPDATYDAQSRRLSNSQASSSSTTNMSRGTATLERTQRSGTRKPIHQIETNRSPSGAQQEGVSSNASDGDDQESDSPSKKRKRSGTSGPRKRRSRAPSLPPYDPSADPGEEIDPTAVTMADLCDDTGRGRVSSKASAIMNNHAAWRVSNREKRSQMRAKMEAKKYGRNPDEEEHAENAPAGVGPASGKGHADPSGHGMAASGAGHAAVSRAPSTDPEGSKGDGYDYTQAMATSKYNVQVRIGPNGETIIDEASLVVDRHQEEDTAEYTHIEESDTTKFVNSASYSKKLRGSRWSAEETDLFYDVSGFTDTRVFPRSNACARRCLSSAKTMS